MDAIKALQEIYHETTTDVDSIDRHEAAAVIASVAAMAKPFATQPEALETPRMLVLSTAHIEYRTSLHLDGKRSGSAPIHYQKGEYGWFIPLIPWDEMGECERSTWTPDLMKVREYAIAHGCTWICLDRDGDVYDDLMSYDW